MGTYDVQFSVQMKRECSDLMHECLPINSNSDRDMPISLCDVRKKNISLHLMRDLRIISVHEAKLH